MEPKFKIGDIIKYSGSKGSPDEIRTSKITRIETTRDISHGDQIWIVVIKHPNYKPGKRIYWHRKNCKLIQKKEEKPDILCKCSIVILMRYGCQCGKI